MHSATLDSGRTRTSCKSSASQECPWLELGLTLSGTAQADTLRGRCAARQVCSTACRPPTMCSSKARGGVLCVGATLPASDRLPAARSDPPVARLCAPAAPARARMCPPQALDEAGEAGTAIIKEAMRRRCCRAGRFGRRQRRWACHPTRLLWARRWRWAARQWCSAARRRGARAFQRAGASGHGGAAAVRPTGLAAGRVQGGQREVLKDRAAPEWN